MRASDGDDLTAESLLAAARVMAGQGQVTLGSTASRAAALLGRSALEEGLWSLFPSLREVNGRLMLVTVNGVLRDDIARRASLAWGRLSAASHHHAYEMPPVTGELTALLDTVHDVIEAIRSRQDARA